ncbi:zinc-dependent alcohol dehydrogenase family protein [Nocardioides jishulii]|uniref:Zinc-dependent alcohol dehydrogenase family protein n=1 Tax=Nocardioides jishulii TaxID=2575440 RepID=A0A4U2YMA2_9ACTN|nr:zinc-dependent alcohol dehydrogenase family protein [Nocardioides jishulii]QCX27569.1 zinc-dependent alcohol dehydrogenase family protein [Nocardioides jishulii]TKI62376.1 zinc-dependent alcohol dehydrogenase family protein [Nocardioides jishulii]
MRATTIHAARDIRFTEVPDPSITEPTDAVVRVLAGCVCGSDLWNYRGENEITPGATIGHECIGEVVEIGADVRDFKVGDHVVVPFCHSDNTCPHCRAGFQSACVHGGFTVSGQGELARVTQADGSLVRVEGGINASNRAALLTLSDVMPTGWHAAVSAGVRPGATVVVVGDGAVGLCGVLAASTMGAEKIIALSRHESRQKIARVFGATHVVAERGKEANEIVKEITSGVGADAVLECVGTDAAIQTAFAVARPGSTVGFVGVPHGVELPVRRMFQKNVGLRGGMAPVRAYLPDLLRRVEAGELDPSPVFDMILPMDQVAEGYAAMDERRAVKVLLEP